MDPNFTAHPRPKCGWVEWWVRGVYAFLFAAVLPLLCWGDLADPRHPHWNAHFVFLEPPTVAAPLTAERLLTVTHDHEPCLHPVNGHPPTANLSTSTIADSTIAETQPLAPNGQAVPATLLAQLVVLVMWAVSRLARPSTLPFFTRLDNAAVGGVILRVPTPPPRLVAWQ